VKRLTLAAYQDNMVKLLRKRKIQGSDTYVWRLHTSDRLSTGNDTAARVVSIRVVDGYFAKTPPKIGNRLLVHALVKFNTTQVRQIPIIWKSLLNSVLQSLQVYSRTGEPLNSLEPRSVVEYLVLEKRMWYDGPWMIRDEILETC
jgi:mitochondrial protein MBA1